MKKEIKILYAEDDITLAFLTRDNLIRAGYSVDHCDSGENAIRMADSNQYDLFILDIMLPHTDGFTIAKHIRKRNQDVPILFLSAKSTVEDKITGLQLGADDYITKPFSIEELLLRIEVFLKRSKSAQLVNTTPGKVSIGKYILNIDEHSITENGTVQNLTHRECELLALLAENPGSIMKRDDIMLKVWGSNNFFSSRSLDVFISRLRKIIQNDPSLKIENVHNLGYRLSVRNTIES